MIFKNYEIEQKISILKNKILLFYGENSGFKDDIKKEIKLSNSKSVIKNYSQEEILKNQDSFYEDLFNISLFGEKKIYFIEKSDDKILNLIENISEKLDDQKIFLYAEILDKKSKLRNYFEKSKLFAAIPCYPDNELSLKKIIIKRLKNIKGLNNDAIKIIINNSNLNRSKLNNELNKIETCFHQKDLKNDELIELLNINENDSFNILRDAALTGQSSSTNKLLNETIIDEDKSFFYLNSVNQRLRKINEILSIKGQSLEQAINALKPPIFWKDKPIMMLQSKKWDQEKIKKIFQETYKVEIKLKSNNNIAKKVLLKKLMVDICNLASS